MVHSATPHTPTPTLTSPPPFAPLKKPHATTPLAAPPHDPRRALHTHLEWRILRWALLSRAWFLALALASRLVAPDWVASSNILFERTFVHDTPYTPAHPTLTLLARTLVRWDAAHFLNIAQDALRYKDEHQAAFFPFVPWVMRQAVNVLGPYVFNHDVPDGIQLALFGVVISNIFFILSTIFIYRLSYQLVKRQDYAFMTAIFYCFQPGSIFLSSIYTEAPFCLFSFAGMWYFERKKWAVATLMWTVCGFLRSNGFLHAGFFAYSFVFHKPHARFLVYSALLFVPFFVFQRYIYRLYCLHQHTQRAWCQGLLGLSYSHLQKQYWNVGWLEYWRVEKLPDISVSVPVYLRTFQQLARQFARTPSPRHRILPYLVLHTFLCVSAIFIFHAQIVIRMFSCMVPLFLVARPQDAQGWWLTYTLIQASVGAVLFSAFFGPP